MGFEKRFKAFQCVYGRFMRFQRGFSSQVRFTGTSGRRGLFQRCSKVLQGVSMRFWAFCEVSEVFIGSQGSLMGVFEALQGVP